MLSIFEELRQAGVVNKTLFEAEFSFLIEYDIEKAIEILDKEIKRCPEDKELSLRRSFLGVELDRPELIDDDPSSIPEADQASPQTALMVVHVLKAINQKLLGIQYAYRVLRRNFQDPDAHMAFIRASLYLNEKKPELEDPDCVEVGAVVCYVEQGNPTTHQIVVKDIPDSSSQFPERELSPDNKICSAMMGKKEGDTFVLAEGIQDRIGEIKKIQNKYVYRFQDCIEQRQVRFPGLTDVQLIRMVPKETGSDEPELDISTILDLVDKLHEEMLKFEQAYKEGPLPLHVFGEHFGGNAFEAVLNLATSPSGLVKCCEGSREEYNSAAETLGSCSTVVLDMSAISSLLLLDELDILKNWSIDFVVSTNTVNELRRMIANKAPLGSWESATLLKTDTGHALSESSSEEKKFFVEKLRNLVDTLETTCRVESCIALAELEPEERDELLQVFGRYGAEAVLLARMPGAVLWTDDLVQAKLAKSKYGVSRVWTQVVIEKCVELSIVEPEVFFDASAKLFGYGYFFTRLNPNIIRQAGIIAEWKIDKWPFSQVLSFLAEEPVDLTQVVMLAAQFLNLLYQELLLPESRKIITEKILENIARKEGGVQEILYLRNNLLPIIFSLNVVGLKQVTETIDAWLFQTHNL
ncbi:MAG: GreA/GreB family elongation factor [Candidatus Dadabacteria bacterium]|nr:GreA/GreB family elongation factor [Candidatus Dadabacteria bacterium]